MYKDPVRPLRRAHSPPLSSRHIASTLPTETEKNIILATTDKSNEFYSIHDCFHKEILSLSMKATLKDATLYQNNNSLQRRDAAEVLQEYSARIRWRPDKRESVLDVGCGDGGVTAHVLRPRLPATFLRLVGWDLAPEMVRHAHSKHADERLQFQVADIVAEVPPHMLGEYDHVFSFYALHWVQEQQKALSNIASLLTPGGDCLLVFLGRIPIYDVFRVLAARPAWATLMADLHKYVSPYQDCARPHRRVRRLLLDAGFRRADVKCRRKVYLYDGVEMVKKAVRAVNPFNQRLSPEQRELFMDEYVDVLRDMGLLQSTNNNDDDTATIRCEYTLIIAHAVK